MSSYQNLKAKYVKLEQELKSSKLTKPQLSQVLTEKYEPLFRYCWNNYTISSALDKHSNGDFSKAADLWEYAVNRDSRLKAIVNTRQSALLGKPFLLEPSNNKQGIVDNINQYLWDITPEHTIRELQFWFIGLGIAVAELVWDFGSTWKPYLKVWHPRHLSYDQENDYYILETREEKRIIDNKNFDGKFFVFNSGNKSFKSGSVLSIGQKWLAALYTLNDWFRTSEKYAGSVIKAEVPANADATIITQFANDIRNLKSLDTLLLPNSPDGKFDANIMSGDAKDFAVIKDLLEHLYEDYAISILGQNLTTKITQGSLAGAKVHQEIKDELIAFDSQLLSTCLRDFVIKPLTVVNYSSDSTDAPYLKWDLEPPEDLKLTAESYAQLANAIMQLKAAGINVDVNALVSQFSIPVIKE